MQNDKMDTSAVYTMFEEIKENQTKQLTAIEKLQPDPMSAEAAPALNSEDGEKIETLTAKLDTVSEKLNIPLKHHHTLDFMGNWALIALVLAVGAFIASLWVINNQRQTLAGFRDNDLKYRYIQMRGEASPNGIERLRDVFDWNRNPDSIRTIRRQVERYEHLIQQQAENEARARLNATEAQRLQNQAETVKRGE
jgi:hypothetical protein